MRDVSSIKLDAADKIGSQATASNISPIDKQKPPVPVQNDNYGGDVQKNQSSKNVVNNTVTVAPVQNDPINGLTIVSAPQQDQDDDESMAALLKLEGKETEREVVKVIEAKAEIAEAKAEIVEAKAEIAEAKTETQIVKLRTTVEELLNKGDIEAAAAELKKAPELSKGLGTSQAAVDELIKDLSKNISLAMLDKYKSHFTDAKLRTTIERMIAEGHIKPKDLEEIAKTKDPKAIQELTAKVLKARLADVTDPALQKDLKEIIAKLEKEGKEASTGNVLDSMGRSKNSIKDLVGECNLLALYRTHVFAQMEEFEKQRKQVEKMNDEQVKNQLKAKEDNDEKRSRQIQDSNRIEANRQEAKRIEHIKTKLASKVGAYKASLLLMYAPDGNISFEVLKSLGLAGVINLIEEGMLLVDQNVEKYLIKNASPDEQERHLPKSTLDALRKEQKIS